MTIAGLQMLRPIQPHPTSGDKGGVEGMQPEEQRRTQQVGERIPSE